MHSSRQIGSGVCGCAFLATVVAPFLVGCSNSQTSRANNMGGASGAISRGGSGGTADAGGKGGAGGPADRADASDGSSGKDGSSLTGGSAGTGGISGAGGLTGRGGSSVVGSGGLGGTGGNSSTTGTFVPDAGGFVGAGGTGGGATGGTGGARAGGTGGSSRGTSGGSNGGGKGGAASTGGLVGTGGLMNRGGSVGTGGSVGAGGAVGSGGTAATGGSVGTGGVVGSGGTVATGGSVGAGGAVGTGGTVATGGSVGTGGAVGTGGTAATGGSVGTGGAVGSGGTVATGGAGTGTGGQGGSVVTPEDGCGSEVANNLTLSQIAVYQSVKIPVMDGGSEVAVSARKAHVVQGRDTMFRMFVTPGSGWTARELSARLTLTAGGTSTTYFSKKSISGASTDASETNSFQIDVPAAAMTASIRYSVQIVECGSQSGSPGNAKFPTTGDIDLRVKVPGGLKITIIPLTFGSLVPDTSASALAVYAGQMAAMYPSSTVTLTVGTTLAAAVDETGAVDWDDMLYQVSTQRSTDHPADDVYYYGLVKPGTTLKAYCGTSCTSGIAYMVVDYPSWNRDTCAAVGVGFGDEDSALTMAHEVGHNHGRDHAPCDTSYPDPSYPYLGGSIGSWGYDARHKTLLDPSVYTDIMGYCDVLWVSDYTYDAITTRIAGVNGAALEVRTTPEASSSWRTLRLSRAKGARWGRRLADALPAGRPEQATVQDAIGNSIATVTVYRTRISELDAALIMIPEPQPGWYAVTVAGAPSMPFAPPTQ